MPFGRRAGPSIQYAYGADAPMEGLDEFERQLRLGHAYRNRLVEIERERRQKVRETLAEFLDPALAEQEARLQSRLAELRAAIRAARQAARQRTLAETAHLEEEARAIRQELKAIRDRLATARRQLARDPTVQQILADIDRWARAARKEARSEFASQGLYWGTYLFIEHAFERARRSRQDPRFKPYTGEGGIAIQLQGGLPWPALFTGSDRRVQVDPVSPAAWAERGRRRRAKLCRTTARVRIGTGPDGTPRWLVVPFWMHRPLPDGATVKWVRVVRQREGLRWRYSILFTVQLPQETLHDPAPPLACGIDLGWRRRSEGLRVAYVVGQDGEEEELVLPESWLRAMDKVADLTSRRTRLFHQARQRLLQWLDAHPGSPAWLQNAAAELGEPADLPERLVQLVETWVQRRFVGDDDIFASLWRWRRHDRRLYDRISNLRANLLRHRREIYRVFAKRLAERYRYIFVRRLDLRGAARRPRVEDPADVPPPARYYRTLAALSVLRQCLGDSLRKYGGTLMEVSAPDATRRCHACGAIQSVSGEAIHHQCTACGSVWDLDRNAAINTLRRGLGERGVSPTGLPGVRDA